jgi:hypothetical protein
MSEQAIETAIEDVAAHAAEAAEHEAKALTAEWWAHHRARMAEWAEHDLDTILRDLDRMKADVEHLLHHRDTTPASIDLTVQ